MILLLIYSFQIKKIKFIRFSKITNLNLEDNRCCLNFYLYIISTLIIFLAAYGNRFDSEDLSHERAFPSKPTRKPHQKKQKTSPTPSDATMMHKEHTATSFNQVCEKAFYCQDCLSLQ